MCLMDCDIDILATGSMDLGPHRGVSTARLALENSCRRKQLRRMANSGNGFVRFGEMLYDA
jgi:hypothetical protein